MAALSLLITTVDWLELKMVAHLPGVYKAMGYIPKAPKKSSEGVAMAQ